MTDEGEIRTEEGGVRRGRKVSSQGGGADEGARKGRNLSKSSIRWADEEEGASPKSASSRGGGEQQLSGYARLREGGGRPAVHCYDGQGTCVWVCGCFHVGVFMWVFSCVGVFMWVFSCVGVFMCGCFHVGVFMCVFMCGCFYVCFHVCVFMCVSAGAFVGVSAGAFVGVSAGAFVGVSAQA